MASLNTLRTRGGVIVSIVIGIALIAFLMGDFVPRSCNEVNVGSIDGRKISYEEFYFQNELYTTITQSMIGKESLSSEESDIARNNAWQSLVMKYAYQPGLAKLGLSNSEAEQVDMVSGRYLSPLIEGNFSNPQNGIFDPAILANFIENIDYDPSGRLQIMWNWMKESMNDQRSMTKYYALVEKGMFVTDLEIENAIAAANRTFDADVMVKEYSSVADSLVQITSADIRDYYNSHKERFKQQPSREIEYVVFDMLPSDHDYEQARTFIETVAAEFAESDSPMQYAQLNSQIAPSLMYLKETQIDGAIAAAVFDNPDAMYGPQLSGDVYTLARLADTQMSPDSIGAKHILLEADQRSLADSLATLIRRGADFEALAMEYSQDPSVRMNGGDLDRFPPERMVPEFSQPLINARVGDVVIIDTDFGIHVAQLTYKLPPVKKAQIATIRYKVDPSSATQQEVYAEASRFLVSAAGSYDNFKKAATEGALSKRVARIRNTDRTISGLDDSRDLVRWAFDHKKGEVSDIWEIGGDYVIAALTEVRHEGYAKPEEVIDAIRPAVLQQKKADMIISGLKGTTLAQNAAEQGVDIKQATDVTFGSFFLDGINTVDQRLAGAITAGESGKLSRPVKGTAGVYLFEVTDIRDSGEATVESERARLSATSASYLSDRLEAALSEAANIKDNRVRYF